MHDPCGVRRGESVEELFEERDRVVDGERPAAEPVAEGLSVQPLHDDVGSAVVDPSIRHAHDRGVRKRRLCPYLVLPAPGVLRPIEGREPMLERDALAGPNAKCSGLGGPRRAIQSSPMVTFGITR